MTDMTDMNEFSFDPMAVLDDYFEGRARADESWVVMKQQIATLITRNREMQRQRQAMIAHLKVKEMDFELMQRENEDMKRAQRESSEYTSLLEAKVKTLTTENFEMKNQIDTKKQMISEAQAELNAEAGYFCGALY